LERYVIISLSLLLIAAAISITQSGGRVRAGEAIVFGLIGAGCAVRYALKEVAAGKRTTDRLHARLNYRMLVVKYRRESGKLVHGTGPEGGNDGRR
jgi:hypothetical protein